MAERQLKSHFTEHLGIDVHFMKDGKSEMSLPMKPEFNNSGGIAHGGVIASLADSVAGGAAFSTVGIEKMAVTTDFNLCFMRASWGDSLFAHGEVIHGGKQFIRVAVEVFCDDTLVATAGVSFQVIDRPKPLEP